VVGAAMHGFSDHRNSYLVTAYTLRELDRRPCGRGPPAQ
jgi:hypothetical protein